MARRLAAIMFTDMAGYTSLSQTDEAAALRLLQEQDRLVRGLLEVHRGRLVKSIGDGLLVEFANALDAVDCAVDLQRHIQERNARELPPELRVRIGIHLGDVEGAGADILGDAVNIASRIEPLADPGGVCLSESVYLQIRNRVPFPLEKLGGKSLKGVQGPVQVYRVQFPAVAKEVPSQVPSPPRIAILPFANISPDADNEYFADGLTEELITVVSQIKGLRVVSRTSVNQYKGTTKPVAQIGSELGADSVLEGSVRKAGDQLRIAVQLIDTRTDEHRWAQTYDRRLENVFAIQADVAERTAGALKVELLASESAAIREKPTSNMEAYESYLRGIEAYRHIKGWWDEVHDAEAMRCLEAAVRLDPAFSAAYSFLANYLLGVMGLSRSYKDTVPRARECAEKALELNPNSSDAHTARGNVALQADLDWVRAEAEFQQAIALNPSSSAAHFWYGYMLANLQRLHEAAKQYRAAIDLDPLWVLPRLNLAWGHAISGDYAAATSAFQRLHEEYPEDSLVLDGLAELHAICGREAQALQLLDAAKGHPDRGSRVRRAVVLAFLGKPEEERALMEDYEAGKIDWYLSAPVAAGGYALLGDNGRALAILERDMREGEKLLWATYQNWSLDLLRDDPRFVTLLKSANLPTNLPRPRWNPPARADD